MKSIKDLPEQGIVKVAPWPSDYYPNWKDGINSYSIDDGTYMSATEKYSAILKMDVQRAEDSISLLNGVDAWAGKYEECMTDADCYQNQGAKCGIRKGRQTGTCIPAWYGLVSIFTRLSSGSNSDSATLGPLLLF